MNNRKGPERFSLLLFAVIFLILLFFSALGAGRFLEYEQRRDLGNWQITLGVMADQASNRLESWIREQFASLVELAGNGSLQLYTSHVQQRRESAEVSVEPAELSYLRNLIRVAADRSGFVSVEGARSQIPANVALVAENSLALFGANLEIMTGTTGISAPDQEVRAVLTKVLESGNVGLVDVRLNQNRRPVLGFAVPVFSLQMGADAVRPVGLLLGMKDVNTHLYPLLLSSPGVLKSANSFLVRREGGFAVNISPLPDGTQPLARRLSIGADGTMAVQAVKEPGVFGRGLDESGNQCLFTSRQIAGTPWILVQSVRVDEALAESRLHRKILLGGLVLVASIFLAIVAVAWFYGSSLRARALSRELLEKNGEIGAQAELLEAITGHVTDLLFLFDSEGRCVLANRAAAEFLGLPAREMEGRRLPGLFGPADAKELHRLTEEAYRGKAGVARELCLTMDDRKRRFHVHVVPFACARSSQGCLLLGLHDFTELMDAHLGRERLKRQTVAALMRAIDLHDPHSANHSANTAMIALAVGRAMGLDEKTLSTIETAANLCNLGRLSIPREVLVKTGFLSDAEKELIHREVRYAQEILAGIEFDGPVIETILGKYEALDGSGPRGLKADALLLSARILAVANAFVAMVSPRAYRDRLAPEVAAHELVNRADAIYDRHVVAALFHIVENDIDWQQWQKNGMLSSKGGSPE